MTYCTPCARTAAACICSRDHLHEVECMRCGLRRVATNHDTITRWAKSHRCRKFRQVGWTPEMDAAVLKAAAVLGGLKVLAGELGVPLTAIRARARVVQERAKERRVTGV